ncbi:uncharacterized protein LOC144090177 [Stigmatopora argus]
MPFLLWWISAVTLPLLVVGNLKQIPSDIIEIVGESAQIECLVNQLEYDYIQWYRLDGANVENLGYMYTGGTFGRERHGNLSCSMESVMTCTITVPNLRPKRSGIYYCLATSHDVAWR